MRLSIIAVGRLKAGPHAALVGYYAERLTFPLALREVEEKRPLPPAELVEREAALLLAAAPPGATMVALDMRGKALASEALAERMAGWQARGVRDLAFFIGGAEGLADSVRRKSALVLSLGPMTWPHLLVRGMLLEQLYRAQQIMAGHPYHRG